MIQYVPQDDFPLCVLYSMSPICLSKKSSLYSNTKVNSEYCKSYLRIPNADQDIKDSEKSCSKVSQWTLFKSATPKGIWLDNPVLIKIKKRKINFPKKQCFSGHVWEMPFWRLKVKDRPRDEEPGGSLETEWWQGQRKGKRGFPGLGSGVGGVLKAETMGSARVEVGRAGILRLITLHPGVFSRANIRCVQLIEFTELGNWDSYSEGSE